MQILFLSVHKFVRTRVNMVLVLLIVAVRCAIDTDGSKMSQLACEQALSVQRLFENTTTKNPVYHEQDYYNSDSKT